MPPPQMKPYNILGDNREDSPAAAAGELDSSIGPSAITLDLEAPT